MSISSKHCSLWCGYLDQSKVPALLELTSRREVVNICMKMLKRTMKGKGIESDADAILDNVNKKRLLEEMTSEQRLECS